MPKRARCDCMTKKGTRCKKPALHGKHRCYIHDVHPCKKSIFKQSVPYTHQSRKATEAWRKIRKLVNYTKPNEMLAMRRKLEFVDSGRKYASILKTRQNYTPSEWRSLVTKASKRYQTAKEKFYMQVPPILLVYSTTAQNVFPHKDEVRWIMNRACSTTRCKQNPDVYVVIASGLQHLSAVLGDRKFTGRLEESDTWDVCKNSFPYEDIFIKQRIRDHDCFIDKFVVRCEDRENECISKIFEWDGLPNKFQQIVFHAHGNPNVMQIGNDPIIVNDIEEDLGGRNENVNHFIEITSLMNNHLTEEGRIELFGCNMAGPLARLVSLLFPQHFILAFDKCLVPNQQALLPPESGDGMRRHISTPGGTNTVFYQNGQELHRADNPTSSLTPYMF